MLVIAFDIRRLRSTGGSKFRLPVLVRARGVRLGLRLSAFYLRLRNMCRGGSKADPEEEPEFEVERVHLIKRLTRARVEQLERVTDPLGAVPNLPFGHLNQAWQAFAGELGPEDELWSFEALWESAWGGLEMRGGYVSVRARKPGRYFMTEWRMVPYEVD